MVVVLLPTTMGAHWQSQTTPIVINTKANVKWSMYLRPHKEV